MVSLFQSLMYKKVRDAQVRSKLSNELMMHHMQVNNILSSEAKRSNWLLF